MYEFLTSNAFHSVTSYRICSIHIIITRKKNKRTTDKKTKKNS